MRTILIALFFGLMFSAMSCKHASVIPPQLASLKAPVALLKKDVDLMFVQENQRLPAHLLYKKQDRYIFMRGQMDTPFRVEMVVNPLMRNPSIVARVERKGKTVREYTAKKTASSVLSEKKTSWTPARSKLLLTIPYVAENEVIVVTTTFEWMDIRWISPILLQEEEMPSMAAKLTVDVPYGVTMHFKAARDAAPFEYLPTSVPLDKKLWVQDDNRGGMGMRYIWDAPVDAMSQRQDRGDLLQVMLSFESPAQNDAGQRFDSWSTVSNYIYNRIDRYDLPSNEIREFAKRETKDLLSESEKIQRILNFLKNDIERRVQGGSFQEQELQPATRTFARRFGTPSDIAILGKSLLTSIGVDSDLLAAADKRFNPILPDFFSPALFNSIILAINNEGKTIYFDPENLSAQASQLPPNRQGQQALMIRAKGGNNVSLPYDSAQKNARTYSYQLWMSDEGVLEGEYSIDLNGFEANNVLSVGKDQLRTKSVAELEAELYGTHRTDFSLESAEIIDISVDNSIRVSGLIKPRLLFKNSQGGFDFKLEKIIEPALIAIAEAHRKGFSSTTKISLFIGLPSHFVVDNLPVNKNINLGGVEGRFYAEAKTGQIVVEGVAMVSLPIKSEVRGKIETELQTIKIFGNQSIAIHDEGLIQGASNDGQSLSEEDS